MTVAAGPPRVLGDRYELRQRLGSGGAGSVWAGHDRALDRPVAVKLLHANLAHDPAVEVRFRTEATAAAKLTHPNAVLVYDVGRDDGDDYLVMEMVTGTSLANVVARGRLPHGAAAAVGAAVGSALGSAHRAGIIHRDVKPGNVLLTTDGQAKLADFGIARALGDLESRLTRTGTVLGTARYLAPEQLRDDPLDARADVYSLGVVLHEVLTGAAPFGEGGAIEVATRRLTTSLPAVTALVPEVPPELAEIVDWATQVEPQARPADGDHLAEALRRFVPVDAGQVIAERVHATGTGTRRPEPPDRSPAAGVAADGAARPHETTTALASSGSSRAATPPSEATATLAAAPPEADVTDGGGASRGSRRVPGWLALVLAAAAVVVGVLVVAPGVDRDDGASPAPTAPQGDEDDGEGESTGALTIADAGDHDPLGPGQQERPEDIQLAIDGYPDTFWPTESYNSADLGGLKEGVGMWVQLDEAADIGRVDVRLTADAGELELWVADGVPDTGQTPDQWGQLVGQGTIEDTGVRFDFSEREVRGETLLLWFTELPAGGNGFRAEVRDIEVAGS